MASNRIFLCVSVAVLAVLSAWSGSLLAGGDEFSVSPTVETDPVSSSGDAADDPCLWIHPRDPSLSRIYGTDKDRGLAVYDLTGNELQFLEDAAINNADLRYNFPLAGKCIALVAGSVADEKQILFHKVDPVTGLLSRAGSIPTGISTYGICLYVSPKSGKYYVCVNSKGGKFEQYHIYDDGTGKIAGKLVRAFSVGSAAEGMVADDFYGTLFVGEEEVALWCYGAEPDTGDDRILIDQTGGDGHLAADVEGLAIYYSVDGTGYLIASSQGNDRFIFYERKLPCAYLATLSLVSGSGIDGVTHTDGIDVTNANLGPAFPFGLFVAQDDRNDEGNQNYKLTPWHRIAGECPSLHIDTSWDPRKVGENKVVRVYTNPIGCVQAGQNVTLTLEEIVETTTPVMLWFGKQLTQDGKIYKPTPFYIGASDGRTEMSFPAPPVENTVTLFIQGLALVDGQTKSSNIIPLTINP